MPATGRRWRRPPVRRRPPEGARPRRHRRGSPGRGASRVGLAEQALDPLALGLLPTLTLQAFGFDAGLLQILDPSEAGRLLAISAVSHLLPIVVLAGDQALDRDLLHPALERSVVAIAPRAERPLLLTPADG